MYIHPIRYHRVLPVHYKGNCTKSLYHTRKYTDITDEEIEIILACKKSFLSDNHRIWVKSHVDNFNVPMGVYNSAQVSDLIGVYILDTLGRIVYLEQAEFTRMTELSLYRIVTAQNL